jgi:hypothetical protein
MTISALNVQLNCALVTNNIDVFAPWSVLFVEETGVPGENDRPVVNH